MPSRTQLLAALATMGCLGATARAAHAQQAALAGTVLADSTERPIVNAEVAIPALNVTTLTDSVGTFALSRLPAGTYQVVVRAVGRVPYRETVTLGATDRIERDFLLTRAVNTLAEVEVKAAAVPVDMRLAEFEERRRVGSGKFLTQAELEKAGGRTLSSVLISRIAGVTAIGNKNERYMVSRRGAFSLRHGGDCHVQVIVDGMLKVQQPGDRFDINSLPPEFLAGLEYYTPSNTPAQYNATGQASCGTLVIWTRWRF